jgi:hypothetical protein
MAIAFAFPRENLHDGGRRPSMSLSIPRKLSALFVLCFLEEEQIEWSENANDQVTNE